MIEANCLDESGGWIEGEKDLRQRTFRKIVI